MVLSSWESGAVLDQGAPAGRVIHSPPEPRQLEFSLATQDVANKTDCAVNRHQGKRRDQGGGRRGRGRFCRRRHVAGERRLHAGRDPFSAARRQADHRPDQLGNRGPAQDLSRFCNLSRRTRLRGAHLRLSRDRRIAPAVAQRLYRDHVGLGGPRCRIRRHLVTRALQGPAARRRRTLLRRTGDRPATQQRHDRAQPAGVGAGRLLGADDAAGKLSRLCDGEISRAADHATARLHPGQARHRRGFAARRFLAVDRLGDARTLLLRRPEPEGVGQLRPVQGAAAGAELHRRSVGDAADG
jgi:hypothetical protein